MVSRSAPLACSDRAPRVFSIDICFYNYFPFNCFTHAFISVVPSVWHIFRVCVLCYFVFFRVLSIWLLSAGNMAAVSIGRIIICVHFGLFVCPPWYLMSYCRCWVYYPGMYYVFYCFECRDWSDSLTFTLPHFLG